jgi:hypothetical protein
MSNIALKVVQVPKVVFNYDVLDDDMDVILVSNEYVDFVDENGKFKTEIDSQERSLVALVAVCEDELEVVDKQTGKTWYLDINEFDRAYPLFEIELP